MNVYADARRPETEANPLELELKAAMSCWPCVLGTRLGSVLTTAEPALHALTEYRLLLFFKNLQNKTNKKTPNQPFLQKVKHSKKLKLLSVFWNWWSKYLMWKKAKAKAQSILRQGRWEAP